MGSFFAKKECFICCDTSGKSRQELFHDSLYGKNAIVVNYPIIELSSAFNCKCNAHAHNTCIAKLTKCPTCRKEMKPNVYYVPTAAEKRKLRLLLLCMTLFLIFLGACGVYCDKSVKNKAQFCTRINPTAMAFMYMLLMFSMYFIVWIQNRWLFDIFRMKSKYVVNL